MARSSNPFSKITQPKKSSTAKPFSPIASSGASRDIKELQRQLSVTVPCIDRQQRTTSAFRRQDSTTHIKPRNTGIEIFASKGSNTGTQVTKRQQTMVKKTGKTLPKVVKPKTSHWDQVPKAQSVASIVQDKKYVHFISYLSILTYNSELRGGISHFH